MKHGETIKICDSWYIYKWKSFGRKTMYASGFGNDENVAICGQGFYSKYQLLKDLKKDGVRK